MRTAKGVKDWVEGTGGKVIYCIEMLNPVDLAALAGVSCPGLPAGSLLLSEISKDKKS